MCQGLESYLVSRGIREFLLPLLSGQLCGLLSRQWKRSQNCCGICWAFFTPTVSLNRQTGLTCSLHTSRHRVSTPQTTTLQSNRICLFQADDPSISREQWVKPTLCPLAVWGGSVFLDAQRPLHSHRSCESCGVILFVEHTNHEVPGTPHLLSRIHKTCRPR